MLGLISAEYAKWSDKLTSQVSMLSHYASIHNTNCCTCLGIKKKKYIPAGTGKRGRPRKYPPPVGYGPGMQRPDTIDEDGNIFEPQIILKDSLVKHEPGGGEAMGGEGLANGDTEGPNIPGMGPPNTSGLQLLGPRPIMTKEELEKRKEYYNNHKNKIKYVCHYCQVHFYHKPNFDYHIARLEEGGKCRIHEKVNNLYLCETCGEGFSWREKLEKHLRLAEQHGTHNQKELLMYGDFQCNMCGKTFNKRTTYLMHVKWHEDREDIPCVICGTMFKQTDLRHHLMEVHSNDSLPCSYCGKLFTARKYLEKHELVHQGGNFPCPECGKTFSQKSNMQQHLKTHALDRDHGCDHCGQTFSQRAGLCHHLKKHFGPQEFTEECEACGQYFSNEYNLKVHKRKVHNMAVEGLPEEQPEYLSSPLPPQHLNTTQDDLREKAFGAANTAVKNMLGMSLGSGVGLGLSMKQEGGGEGLEEAGIHMREANAHMGDMRHMVERRDVTSATLMKDPLEDEEHLRMSQHHMGVTDDTLHMPQDLTRMTANQAHMSDDSGRMSAAPQSPLLTQGHNMGGNDMRTPNTDSPNRITDTPHMNDNLGRMTAENFGRMTGTPGGYLAEHLRRMAENQSRMSDSMSHYEERDNYSRLGDNLRSMSRGSAGDPMGRLGDNLGRMTDNLSHMGVIRPTQTPSSTPQWPPHMQNHAALDGMNQTAAQASQHALYPLPFWPYDPALRQYHH
ncbi:Zinc finger protein 2 [Chionoecetes opilio]|uniref:Zinc finger protein 2 n=1 Tax=Chionoecetes opilio TaxID=41210 RepID=A0A8J5CLK0_CHIOP|nr:Zinc finger protein 2 [Chionoecetes opilio]